MSAHLLPDVALIPNPTGFGQSNQVGPLYRVTPAAPKNNFSYNNKCSLLGSSSLRFYFNFWRFWFFRKSLFSWNWVFWRILFFGKFVFWRILFSEGFRFLENFVFWKIFIFWKNFIFWKILYLKNLYFWFKKKEF